MNNKFLLFILNNYTKPVLELCLLSKMLSCLEVYVLEFCSLSKMQ